MLASERFGEPCKESKTPGKVAIHYVDIGDDSQPAVVLIMGLACQLTAWPVSLVRRIRARGYRVILFDNRDIGLSSETSKPLRGSAPVAFARYRLGLEVAAPYTLYDMARDVVNLLDHLNLPSAHVVGISMGGMITQILCARHASRVLTATIIMSSDNHPKNPAPDLKVLWHMNGGGIRGHHFDAAMSRATNFWQAVQSPDFPGADAERLKNFQMNYHRSYRPEGILRQMRAIMATGHLRDLLPRIDLPVQIIHGTADPLVKVACGQYLAQSIKNSVFRPIKGMGHDLPEQLMPDLARMIDHHIRSNSEVEA
ncbi:MAG: alpha/beta hydrolase [Proteobacteria bacterium]|nr:MAG: alpha/beta hydrolase [Pseudomonadota bacterium]PIE40048.1 MAG: alpha/beta hydrolase [Gammaproteobacteria bacterium]